MVLVLSLRRFALKSLESFHCVFLMMNTVFFAAKQFTPMKISGKI